MKQEVKTWTLLLGAILAGSVAATATSGCRNATEPVSESEAIETDVAADSNVTGQGVETPAPAETPAISQEEPPEPASAEPAEPAESAEPAPAESAEESAADVEELNPADGGSAAAAPATRETAVLASAKVAKAEIEESRRPAAASPDDPQAVLAAGGDWPQWGGTRLRNNTPHGSGIPVEFAPGDFDRRTGEWDPSEAKNIKWVAPLGSQTYGNPVIAGGRVFVGTNNGAGYLPRYPLQVDLGCLLAFDEQTGEFLWQHSSEKLDTGRVHDWPLQGVCSAAMVEGDRLWFVTNRGEVRCLDAEGFYDGEDDGPVTDEPARVADIPAASPEYEAVVKALGSGSAHEALVQALAKAGMPLDGEANVETLTEGKKWQITGTFAGTERSVTATVAGPRLSLFKTLSPVDKHEADVVWVFNMMEELNVSQHNMANCSVTSYGDLLFVNTSNGLDETHISLPAPDAPSFICMDKHTGEVYWTDTSPGENILHGQWSSPAVAELGGVPQVLFAGGDGWLYSFRADRGTDGSPELLWKFDCNPKESEWILGGAGTRNNIIATPVVYDGLVYIAVGQDPEHGEGEGHLWCIDPTKRGDVSPQLAMKLVEGERVPIPHRRLQAVKAEEGELAVDNPNSAAVWHYSKSDVNGDGVIDFEEEMHRSCGTVAIKDDLLFISDFSGILHCLDAKGTKDGQPIVHWTHDMLAQSWGSPLIVDGHVYIGDEDGDLSVFRLSADPAEAKKDFEGELVPINADEDGYVTNMGTSIYSTPVVANGVLYISTKDRLFAIAAE